VKEEEKSGRTEVEKRKSVIWKLDLPSYVERGQVNAKILSNRVGEVTSCEV